MADFYSAGHILRMEIKTCPSENTLHSAMTQHTDYADMLDIAT